MQKGPVWDLDKQSRSISGGNRSRSTKPEARRKDN